MHTITDERLQHMVDVCDEFGVEAAIRKLGKKEDTMRRYLGEAKSRGIEPATKHGHLPRILVFDLENAPTEAAVWGMFKQFIRKEQIVSEWYMLSWSAKWLFEPEIYSDVLTPDESIQNADKRIMESLWTMIDQADILIGHNILGFDIQKMNTRFVVNGIMPPSSVQAIDTLLQARKNFAFSRNDLDYLCLQFGLSERKAHSGGMERWLRCIKGDADALKEMEKYNRQDIAASEELYLAMLPWMKSHPNLALYMDQETDACHRCGSIDLDWLKKPNGKPKCYVTNVNQYPEYRCNKCDGNGRSRFSEMSKEDRRHITSPVAR